MRASQKEGNLDGSRRSYYQPVQELESHTCPPSQNLDHRLCSDDGSQTRGYHFQNSPSTANFSSQGSPISQPDSHSYTSDTHHSPDNTISSAVSGIFPADDDLSHKIRELETAMLGPDSDTLQACNIGILVGPNQKSSETEKWRQTMEIISRRDLKGMLIACAKSVGNNDALTVEWLMSALRQMVSVSGDPMQRLGAYMLEGLVARLASSGSSIYKAMKCKEPAGPELLSYMHLLYEICPYFKFGYMSANGAIAEATKDENRIHIIDFQISQGSQWITLIQALAARPGGPPRICITGIDDTTSAYARGGGLDVMGQRLSRFAESCRVPFEFRAMPVPASRVEVQHLRVRPGEALAVNFALMLHHMPDESVGTDQNHRDRLLRLVKSLSPKIVTLVEQEANTNTAPFLPRFIEALSYYSAVFESIDVTLPREHKERINVEQHCLAGEIVNVIACEGAERVERHELLGKWRSRFLMAGFTPYPLNSVVNATIKALLENYSENYRLEERDGALYLGWMNRALVASCAWK